MNATTRKFRRSRSGAILVLTGLLLLIFLGMVALAVDLGMIMMTRTQLQSSSDAGSLAGGTELLSGLGVDAYRTPAQVKANAETQAVNFVALHRAGEASSTHIVASRDVRMGTAALDTASGSWTFVWGATPYNAVGVTTLRSSVGSTAGDKQLPLVFAPVLGQTHADITTDSVAVILPAVGIHIEQGETTKTKLSPFAFSLRTWTKYLQAKADYLTRGTVPLSTDLSVTYNDPDTGLPFKDANNQDELLYYEWVEQGSSGDFEARPLFTDNYLATDPSLETVANIGPGQDDILEMNIYPISSTAGNFGTIDIGNPNNSTADLVRQILGDVSADDLAYYDDSTFAPYTDPITGDVNAVVAEGDTGVSAGIKAALESIVGQCRLVSLYSEVANPGNNASYTLVHIEGMRIMDVDLTGNPKSLTLQPCTVSDAAGIPDYDGDIGTETSFFTPLILAK